MRSSLRKIGRGGFVVMTAAALGFGATMAFAPPEEARASSHCNQGPCNGSCRASGAQYGFCDSVGCVCVM